MEEYRRVVELDKLIEVPYEYIECSVCGKWFPRDHFKNEDQQHQSRTNCTSCYSIGGDDMEALSSKTKEYKMSHKYKALVDELNEIKAYVSNSISVSELIEALQKLPSGARLIVTQDGYYASGNLGFIYTPEKGKEVDGVEYYSIGHSSQNY